MITVAPSSGGSGPPGTPKQWQCALQYGNRYRPGPGPCTPTGRKPPQRQARIASHRSAILLPSPSHKPVLSSAQTGVPRPQARGPLPPPSPSRPGAWPHVFVIRGACTNQACVSQLTDPAALVASGKWPCKLLFTPQG